MVATGLGVLRKPRWLPGVPRGSPQVPEGLPVVSQGSPRSPWGNPLGILEGVFASGVKIAFLNVVVPYGN